MTMSDQLSNVQNQYEKSGTLLDTNILVISSVAIGGVVAAGAFGQAIAQRSYGWLAPILFFCLVAGSASFSYTLERIATQRADAIAKRADQQGSARKVTKITSSLFLIAGKNVARYCGADLRRMGRRTRAEYKSQCDRWQQTLERERMTLKAEQQPTTGRQPDMLGATVKRFAEIALGRPLAMKIDDVGTVTNLLWPLAVLLGGMILTSFGAAGQRIAPEFSFEVSGRAAEDAKVKRFVDGFRDAHGRTPTPSEISGNLDMDYRKAQAIRKKLVAA